MADNKRKFPGVFEPSKQQVIKREMNL